MAHFTFSTNNFSPKIALYRRFVALATLLYALLYTLNIEGYFLFSADILLLTAPMGVHTLWQIFSAPFIIPYPGLSLSLLFDLGFLNFFLTPLFDFVYSYLSGKRFCLFIGGITAIGLTTFYTLPCFFSLYPYPSSLFSGISFATIVFWSLLHYKGQKSLFLVFPISRFWIFWGTAFFCLGIPYGHDEWLKCVSVLCMGLASYLYGISVCRLRSNIRFLTPFEEGLDKTCREGSRIWSWYILRNFRTLKQKLK
jgi:hypothetical protein